MGEELAEVEAELQRLVEEPARALWHAAEQMDARRKLLKDKYQDAFLGPQWTEKTEARYKVHCERRRGESQGADAAALSQVQGGEALAQARQVDRVAHSRCGGARTESRAARDGACRSQLGVLLAPHLSRIQAVEAHHEVL